MPQINQLASRAILGGDITVKNYTGTDIPAFTAVKFDIANPGGTSNSRGVITTTSDANSYGVTLTVIPAGKQGLIRTHGEAVCVASGSISLGDTVMTDATGKVLVQTAGKYQLGIATSVAVANDQVTVDIARAKNA